MRQIHLVLERVIERMLDRTRAQADLALLQSRRTDARRIVLSDIAHGSRQPWLSHPWETDLLFPVPSRAMPIGGAVALAAD